jgi:hypothetical protein
MQNCTAQFHEQGRSAVGVNILTSQDTDTNHGLLRVLQIQIMPCFEMTVYI